MALIKCPECGADISDTANNCPNCGYNIKRYLKNTTLKDKNKKSLRITIFIFACVVLALAGLLIIGKGSLKIGTNILKSGSFECIKLHDLQDATCQHGQICKRCGSEIGTITDHKWLDATCEHGRKCDYCGLEDGEKANHSCRIGYCKNCGEYITELLSVYTEVKGHMDKACDMMSESIEYLGNARRYSSTSASNISKANAINKTICDEFDAAIKACGTYEEFNKVKTYLMQAKGKVYLFDTIQNNSVACYTYVIEISKSLGDSANSVTEAYYVLSEYAK